MRCFLNQITTCNKKKNQITTLVSKVKIYAHNFPTIALMKCIKFGGTFLKLD